jgi:type IV pilus assembly protein PilA
MTSGNEELDQDQLDQEKKERLAQLAFAGVIGVLIVLYLVRNIDRYEDLSNESRYKELVTLVAPIKSTVESSLQAEGEAGLSDLDSGMDDLPDEVFVSADAHGITVSDGQIIATWMNDESDMDGVTYILTPSVGPDNTVSWETSGTCLDKNFCD